MFLQLNCSFPVSTGVPAWGEGACLGGACTGGCVCPGGSAWGVSAQGGLHGGVSTQGGYHVTYPIMHLMLPVCCLHTN